MMMMNLKLTFDLRTRTQIPLTSDPSKILIEAFFVLRLETLRELMESSELSNWILSVLINQSRITGIIHRQSMKPPWALQQFLTKQTLLCLAIAQIVQCDFSGNLRVLQQWPAFNSSLLKSWRRENWFKGFLRQTILLELHGSSREIHIWAHDDNEISRFSSGHSLTTPH